MTSLNCNSEGVQEGKTFFKSLRKDNIFSIYGYLTKIIPVPVDNGNNFPATIEELKTVLQEKDAKLVIAAGKAIIYIEFMYRSS